MEHILLEGKKLFAAKDVAKHFLIDNSALNAWLRINDTFRENNEYIVEMGGGKRPRRFFTERGVSVYQTIKDKPRNNQYNRLPEKEEFNSLYTKKKETTALRAYDINSFAQDPIISMRMKQLEQESRIQRLENIEETRKLESMVAEKELLALPTPIKQAPQRTVRSLVVECVRLYSQKSDIAYNVVWSKLYKEYSIRTKINLSKRAKSNNLPALEYVDQSGDIETLYAIAKEIL